MLDELYFLSRRPSILHEVGSLGECQVLALKDKCPKLVRENVYSRLELLPCLFLLSKVRVLLAKAVVGVTKLDHSLLEGARLCQVVEKFGLGIVKQLKNSASLCLEQSKCSERLSEVVICHLFELLTPLALIYLVNPLLGTLFK